MIKVINGKKYKALSVMIWVTEGNEVMLSGIPMGGPISNGLMNSSEDIDRACLALGLVTSKVDVE